MNNIMTKQHFLKNSPGLTRSVNNIYLFDQPGSGKPRKTNKKMKIIKKITKTNKKITTTKNKNF